MDSTWALQLPNGKQLLGVSIKKEFNLCLVLSLPFCSCLPDSFCWFRDHSRSTSFMVPQIVQGKMAASTAGGSWTDHGIAGFLVLTNYLFNSIQNCNYIFRSIIFITGYLITECTTNIPRRMQIHSTSNVDSSFHTLDGRCVKNILKLHDAVRLLWWLIFRKTQLLFTNKSTEIAQLQVNIFHSLLIFF